MVGCRESQALTTTNSPPSSVRGKEPVKELQTETSCVIDGDATDVDDTEMTESNVAAAAAAGGGGGGLTARRVREEGKKPEPSSQHRSSPDRNYSQAADSAKSQAVTSSCNISRRGVDQTGHSLIHHRRRHTSGGATTTAAAAAAATPAAMMGGGASAGGALGDAATATSASAEAGMDVDFDEAHDEVLQVGKEMTPRYEQENLDSSPDSGRRDGSLANSRHICKVCSREFPSGRALGGHMRAHGSGDPQGGGILANQQQQLNNSSATPSQSPRASASQLAINAADNHNHAHNEPNPESKPSSVILRSKSTSPESRARARSQREIHNRRSAPARRSNGKARPRERTITPKSSVEDATAINAAAKLENDDEDNAVSNSRDHASSEAAQSSSSSSEDDANSEGGNEIENVCDVCSEEFENGKQLHSHKKSHEVYALRSNPKRSRRFIDQDYTECAPSTNAVPTKKQSTSTSNDDCVCPYPDCPKRFPSWKALFGHMRCHPDRTWRGIHPPTEENGTGPNAGGGDRQQRRKKVRPSSIAAGTSRTGAAAREAVAAAAASESEPEPEPEREPEHVRQNGKSPVSEEIESDTESIEAAYMNGEAYMTEDRHQATSTTGWWGTGVTGKRSKRSRQSVRSVHLVHAGGSGGASTSRAPAPPTTLPDMSEELNAKETAEVMIMMMNSATNGGQQFELGEVRRGFELSLRRGIDQHHRHSSGASPRRQEERAQAAAAAGAGDEEEMTGEGDDVEQVVEEFRELGEGAAAAEDAGTKDEHDEWKPMDLDRESVSDDGDDEKEGQLEEASTSKIPKYQCNTCKRSFRSHQALGGHRASHKKVKGCFARTNVGEQAFHEDETSDELLRSEEQLPTELNDASHSDGDDKDRQLTSASKEESSTADIVVHPTGAAAAAAGASASTKKGAHRCTECGRCFDSGQALGGHKRCHFDPTKKDGDKENSSSNNGGKNQRTSNPGGRASSSQGRGKNEGAEGRGTSPRVRNTDLGLHLQQAVPGQQHDFRSSTTLVGERVPSAQVLRPVKPLDLNLPAPVNDEEDEEMQPRNGFSPSARGSQIENQEPKALSEEIGGGPADGERNRTHVEYHFTALLPTLGYQPFECSQCGQRFFSHDALTQHAATPHKKEDQIAMGSFIKRIIRLKAQLWGIWGSALPDMSRQHVDRESSLAIIIIMSCTGPGAAAAPPPAPA
ncbi:hypothetical protein R1sor_014811 [Riccia sorocarpa]|uniref:C2H2-type domain-containing protein n=1 Tax=Riccia sorocarpa TaxID=122646 RepID=A0ABD3HAG3_9MARC